MYFRSTKIIATLGPACSSKAILKKMVESGASAFRINTAHGSFAEYSALVSTVRSVSKEIPIIVDLKGPQVRLKTKATLKLNKGDEISIGFSPKSDLYFSMDFYSRLNPGMRVLFEDGKYDSKIIEKNNNKIKVRFSANAVLENNKGVNIPGSDLKLPFLSQKDLQVIKWAKKKSLSFFALSFAQNAEDLKKLRKKVGKNSILIAKIESKTGVKNFSEILKECEGVMIARGDLGAEVSPESIPLLQKVLVKEAVNSGKFSIVATQMLESMIKNRYPTRAEVSDIANSVLDGADCLMLSGETSIGVDPVGAVHEMRSACEAVEQEVPNLVQMDFQNHVSDSVTKSVYQLTNYLHVNAIVAYSRSGFTAQMISRFRTKVPIIGLCWSTLTYKLLLLHFGVFPLLISKTHGVSSKQSLNLVKKKFNFKKGDTVIITGNIHSLQKQHSNLIEVQKFA
ncbi:MAG TPA: pyruvate kinase [archaeon]|nr:pyruvate kinase [archaeon]